MKTAQPRKRTQSGSSRMLAGGRSVFCQARATHWARLSWSCRRRPSRVPTSARCYLEDDVAIGRDLEREGGRLELQETGVQCRAAQALGFPIPVVSQDDPSLVFPS